MICEDRRKYPRVSGSYQVDLVESSPNEVLNIIGHSQIIDVSRDGFQVVTRNNVPIGSTMSLLAYFIGKNSVCQCEVRWKKEILGKFYYGLQVKKRIHLFRPATCAA